MANRTGLVRPHSCSSERQCSPERQNCWRYRLSAGSCQTAIALGFDRWAILIAINRRACIPSGKLGFTRLWQLVLTFLVPSAVSTLSTAMAINCQDNSDGIGSGGRG